MILLRPDFNDRARTFGRYPSLSAAARTFSAVLGLTDEPGVKTRETADWLTPAKAATSSDVTLSFANSQLPFLLRCYLRHSRRGGKQRLGLKAYSGISTEQVT